MIANYHCHTSRCNHATGTDEEYVRRAVEGGLQIMGFSDHNPYWYPGEYYSRHRMKPEELEEYCQSVLSLREKYASRLQLHVGLEVEYYADLFPEFIRRLQDSPVEYMILGQHYLSSEEGGTWYSGRATEEEQRLEQYCDQVLEAIYTGLFTYIAHPDLLRYAGPEEIYNRHIRRLCQGANACGVPLEINFLGLQEGRWYPNERFWRLAAEENCQVVLGCDAHQPDRAWAPETEKRALEIISKYGLQLLPTVEFKKISL